MLVFSYSAKDKNGVLQTGEVEAENQTAAAKILIAKEMFPIDIAPADAKSFAFFERVSLKDKVVITRQLATMIKAGLPVSQSLKTLIEQTDKKSIRHMLEQVSSDVEGGSKLSDSFARNPKLFTPLDVAIIGAGESSGNLDTALIRLADQLQKEQSLKRKIVGALIYPIVLMVVAVVFLFAMSIFVMPQLEGMYNDFGKKLPAATQGMINVSKFLRGWGALVVIVLIIGIIALIRVSIKKPEGRLAWDTIKLNIPGVSVLLKKLYVARITRTMSGLVSSGVALLDTLKITSISVGNVVYEKSILEVREKVKSGVNLSDAFREQEIYQPVVPDMIAVGEKTGEMDAMLTNLAEYFEEEVDSAVKNITELIMPFAIIILGLIIGGLLLTSLYPIYTFKP